MQGYYALPFEAQCLAYYAGVFPLRSALRVSIPLYRLVFEPAPRATVLFAYLITRAHQTQDQFPYARFREEKKSHFIISENIDVKIGTLGLLRHSILCSL